MILHCERCSLGGENMGEHSEVAIIDEARLKLPLRGDMFKSVYPPETGVGDPWAPDLEWRYMYCPKGGGQHLVFSTPDDDVWEMLERGGPKRILTDKGWVTLLEDGWHCDEGGVVVEQLTESPSHFKQVVDQLASDEPITANGGDEIRTPLSFQCPHCDFVGKSEQSLKIHMGLKHKGE